MKKQSILIISLLTITITLTIALRPLVAGSWNMPNAAGLVIERSSTSASIHAVAAGDTAIFGYPLASSTTEITKSSYDTESKGKPAIGRSLFYYTDTTTTDGKNTVHYYRYEVHFVYLSAVYQSDGSYALSSSTLPKDSCLWRVTQKDGDGTNVRRYQHIKTGKWVRYEVNTQSGTVSISLVDNENQSSAFTHQWTSVLDYTQHHRTFAYPLVTDNATNYYLYYDRTNARWAHTSDSKSTDIYPAYYEKYSLRKDADTLEITDRYNMGANYFAYQTDAATAEKDTFKLELYPTLQIYSGYYSVAGQADGFDSEYLYTAFESTSDWAKLKKRGYSYTSSLKQYNGEAKNVYTSVNGITGAGIYNQPTYSSGYSDAARTLLSLGSKETNDTGTDADADLTVTKLEFRVTPKGKSPLNWITGMDYSQKDSVIWANFTDSLCVCFSKNGTVVECYALPVIRESHHYYEEEKLVPTLSIAQHTFPATGGSVTVSFDAMTIEHTIGLYDYLRHLKSQTDVEKESLTPGSQECLNKIKFSAQLDNENCDWLTINKDKEMSEGGTWVTLTASANTLNTTRSNTLVQSFTYKKNNKTTTWVIPLTQESRTSAGAVKYRPQQGFGYSDLNSEGRQRVHTHETTIYYYPGEVVELRPRERNFFGYQRWYDYATGADPRFYRSTKDSEMKEQTDFWHRPPLKNINDNGVSWWLFDSINHTAETSQGLYYTMEKGKWWMWNGADNAGSLSELEGGLSNYVIPLVLGWDTTGTDLPAKRDIAVDLSNYTDYSVTSEAVQEPTISYRQVYHLRPASQMADSLSGYTVAGGKYFEDYTITGPVNKSLLLQTRYASAYPYNDNATMNRPSDLCYYINVQINTLGTPRDTILRLTMSDNLDKVAVQFYKNGTLQDSTAQVADGTNYQSVAANHPLGTKYDYRAVKSSAAGSATYEYRIMAPGDDTYGGSFGKEIWEKYNGIRIVNNKKNNTYNKDILLARWTVNFANRSDHGPSTTALITAEDIARDYVLLAKKDFNYDKPGTTKCTIYPVPLGEEESTFGYCYPYSKSQGKSFRGTAAMSGEGDTIPFPFYGEYAIVNAVGRSHPTERGQYSFWGYNIEQRGGAENGYCLYVDGSLQSGKVVTLSTDATICSGQQLYCSAWVARANWSNASPVLQFDIEGKNTDGEWESIGAFCTGELEAENGAWQQVNFPIVGSQNYTETRISVHNYASDNSGNDFMLDDIYLYATPIPLEAFQATTNCNRNAKGDQMVTVIKADYTQFTNVDKYGKTLYYDIYDIAKSKAVTTNYYQGDKSATADYGYLVTPAEDYTPSTAETVLSVQALIDSIGQYDNDTTLLRYIRNYETSNERWVLYLAQLVHQSPLSAKKSYEVRTAYSEADLDKAECAMRTKLPIFEKTAFLFNGETYPAAGQCANGLYPLEILVTDTITDGDKKVNLQAYAKGDWLMGTEGDDPWYYSYLDPEEEPEKYQEMTETVKAVCDAAFEKAYGYSRTQVDNAIADLRRDTTGNRKSNYLATSLDEVNANTEYWDDHSHYDIIKTLVNQGKLILWQERQQIYMRSQDTCRYWIYPIAGTAKTVYNGNTYILNECASPTYIMVFSVESDYVLNLSRKALKDITGNEVPRVRISESDANKQFCIPIQEIGSDVNICYDSTQVVLSTDPVVSPLIGTAALSMHYTQNLFTGSTGEQKYYESGDSIFFRPIDQAHVDSMRTLYAQGGWASGHPGLWIVNTHPMRAGYEYTLRLQMMTRTSNAMDDPKNEGCLIGYSYINVVVVPDTLIWTPTAMTGDSIYLWGDDRNWRGIVDGQTLSWGYTPLKSTMVILPEHNNDFLNEMKYPTIMPDEGDNILYPEDVHYHTNVCKKVQFRSGAKILGQENLAYSEAYVNASLKANGWYTIASPLKSVYSGDLFIPHTGTYGSGSSTESGNDFEVRGFAGSRDSLAAYAFWASYYNQDVVTMHDYGKETIESTTANFTESNSLGVALEAGQGVSVAGFGPNDDEQTLTLKLPKPEAAYNYYDHNGNPTGLVETLNRDSAYRLGFIPSADGAMHIALSIKNEKTDGHGTPIAGQQGFLFGNPTMAYINMQKFLSDNLDVLSQSGYQIQVDGAWKSIIINSTTTDYFLQPMQSAMVLSKDATGSIRSLTVKLLPEHLSLVPRSRTTTAASAPARVKGRTFRSERMTITAVSGGQDTYGDWQYQRGETKFAIVDFSSNAYDPDEDLPFISSGVEYGVNDATSTTPVNIYTMAGNKLLNADLRPEMNTVPLGFVLHKDYRSDSLTLFFHTGANWTEECYLCDSKTGEKTRIYNDMRIRIASPANHEVRYYLQGEAYDPNPTPTDNNTPTIDTDKTGDQVEAFSNAKEQIVVVATSDIAEIRLYDTVGRLLTTATPSVETAVYTLYAPTGLVIADITLRNGATAHKKVMVQ